MNHRRLRFFTFEENMPRKKHRSKGTRFEKLRKALCEKDVMGGLGGGKLLKKSTYKNVRFEYNFLVKLIVLK